jgi:hypothetical protein
MPSILKSNKGIETAPLFIIFSAVVILLAATMIMPELAKWGRINDYNKTKKEAVRVSEAIDEMRKLGDSGSAQEIHVDVPANCYIRFEVEGIISYCTFPNADSNPRDVIPSNTKFSEISQHLDNDQVTGSVNLVIAHWNGKEQTTKGNYVIYVK